MELKLKKNNVKFTKETNLNDCKNFKFLHNLKIHQIQASFPPVELNEKGRTMKTTNVDLKIQR